MPNSSLTAAVDRLNRAAEAAGDADVALPHQDAVLLRELICGVKSAQCRLQDAGEVCSCGLLDMKCSNRYQG